MESKVRKSLSRDQLLWIYRHMTLIRKFEERLKWLVETGVPAGPVHLYAGEEVVAVGICAALEIQWKPVTQHAQWLNNKALATCVLEKLVN